MSLTQCSSKEQRSLLHIPVVIKAPEAHAENLEHKEWRQELLL